MSENRNKIINLIVALIIVILIIIIILLLFWKKGNSGLKPSGNIDIFEITCVNNCEHPEDKDDKNDKEDEIDLETEKQKEQEKTENEIKEKIENEIKENFSVLNSNGVEWNATKKLNIFTNPMYDMEEKIAPESTNIYQFIVRNNTIYNLKYTLEFIEENDMNINMKYRLKKNDNYVVGNEETWVTYNELNLNKISSKTKTSDTYYLEWKWFSSDNDTAVGEKGNIQYTLNINIKAEQDI